MTGTNAPYDEALTEAERYIKWPELQPSSRITLLIAKALVAQRSERGEYLRGLEDAAKKCDEAARTWREGPKSHTDAPAEMAEICARNIRVFKNAPEAPSPNRNAEILRAYAPPSPVAAHTDHPLRHCDRTCPACIAEGQAASGGTPSLKRRMSKIEDEVAQGRMSAAEVFTKMREVVNAAPPSATAAPVARPISEWSEADGDVVLWHFPICEPPRIGSPLDTEWPLFKDWYTHWTPLAIPSNGVPVDGGSKG